MNKQQKTTHQQKLNYQKLPLQSLSLKELENLAGGVDRGAGTVECPACCANN